MGWRAGNYDKETKWKKLEVRKCGWWFDIGVGLSEMALKDAVVVLDVERCEKGACGRKLVDKKYTWTAVVKVMANCYEGILK